MRMAGATAIVPMDATPAAKVGRGRRTRRLRSWRAPGAARPAAAPYPSRNDSDPGSRHGARDAQTTGLGIRDHARPRNAVDRSHWACASFFNLVLSFVPSFVFERKQKDKAQDKVRKDRTYR